jgi:hypothetical protein
MRKLTIGMVIYDDWNGFYFSIQSLRLYHSEIMNNVEFVIINTNPTSQQGVLVKNFCDAGWIKEPLHYYEDDNSKGAFTKEKVFDYSRTPYVLVMDCHVLLKAGSLKWLIEYYDSGKDEGNLIQGPLLYDHLEDGPSYFKPEWRGGMLGTWAMDDRSKFNEPFEIPGQGMGVFSCRKDSWLGFPAGNTEFGGEEIIINEKFKQNGKKTLCAPLLKWVHRFNRSEKCQYPNRWESRFKNYVRGYLELDKPIFEIIEHFKTLGLKEKDMREWLNEVLAESVT